MGLRGRAVRSGPCCRGARREVKCIGAEQSNGLAGKAELTAGPGYSEGRGATRGVSGLRATRGVRDWAGGHRRDGVGRS